LGGPAAGVDAGQLVCLRIPNQGEQIAARTVHHGFHQAEHGICGDGGIRRGTSASQNLGAGLGREGLRGSDNAAPGNNHGAGLRAILRGREGGEGHEDEPEPRMQHEGLFYIKCVCRGG
jgi:hypothetical protein